jgi:hypothetical protein
VGQYVYSQPMTNRIEWTTNHQRLLSSYANQHKHDSAKHVSAYAEELANHMIDNVTKLKIQRKLRRTFERILPPIRVKRFFVLCYTVALYFLNSVRSS